MGVEIERKFLLPVDPVAHVGRQPGERLRQGYIAIEGEVEVRVRIGHHAAVVTIKAGRGVARTEVEMPIGADDAEDLWTHTAGRRIDKTRHRVEVGAHVVEVDVFHGDLAGLYVAEVEFASEAAAAAFTPPPWFGRELTGDDRWSNAHLARHGRPL